MLTQFRTLIAPEFASKTDEELTTAFAFWEQGLNVCVFGSRLNEAVMLLTAHRFAMLSRLAAQGGATSGMGPVIAKAAGGTSEQYGGPAFLQSVVKGAADAELAQTAYGMQFLALRNTRAGGRLGIA